MPRGGSTFVRVGPHRHAEVSVPEHGGDAIERDAIVSALRLPRLIATARRGSARSPVELLDEAPRPHLHLRPREVADRDVHPYVESGRLRETDLFAGVDATVP